MSYLPCYRLTIRALPSPVPAPRRLAQVLKRVLRDQGFRCVEVTELPVEAAGAAQDAAGGVEAEDRADTSAGQ